MDINVAAHRGRGIKPSSDVACKQPPSRTHAAGPSARPRQALELLQRAVENPAAASPAAILALQRTAGNRAVTRLVQAKLMVGPVGDHYEREADRVAAQMVSMPAPVSHQRAAVSGQPPVRRQAEEEEEILAKPLAASITPLNQRQEIPEEEEELQTKPLVQRQELPEEEELQMKPLVQRQADGRFQTSSSLEQRLATHKGGGSPLPDDARAYMEPRFGADFSGVRIHTDGKAAQMTQEFSAHAFTHGQDIYFGAGKYDPGPDGGKRLLAHELTHVVQQGGAGAHHKENIHSDRIQGVWDLNNPNWGSTALIEPLDNRGTALLFTDNAGDKMVLKMSENPIELEKMMGAVYFKVGRFRVADVSEVTNQVGSIRPLVRNRVIARGERWVDVAERKLMMDRPRGLGATMVAAQAARNSVADDLGQDEARPYVHVFSFMSGGTDTEKLAQQGQFKPLLLEWKYLVQLGRLAALDIFLQNSDRVLSGNLGNWFTDISVSKVSALIDNADHEARALWISGTGNEILMWDGSIVTLDSLAPGAMLNTAASVAHALRRGARLAGEFNNQAEENNWRDTQRSDGGTNGDFMAEALAVGLTKGKRNIVLLLHKEKMGSVGRHVKAVASQGQPRWWNVLKERAKRLEQIG
jgi:hypothetical protein